MKNRTAHSLQSVGQSPHIEVVFTDHPLHQHAGPGCRCRTPETVITSGMRHDRDAALHVQSHEVFLVGYMCHGNHFSTTKKWFHTDATSIIFGMSWKSNPISEVRPWVQFFITSRAQRSGCGQMSLLILFDNLEK
jgi:hypothetical protein